MKLKLAIVTFGIILAIALTMQSVSTQPPPPPVEIEGDVVYAANGTRVPDGWTVTITDKTTGDLLATGITNDVSPEVPQYKVIVDSSLIVMGHVIEAYSENPNRTLNGAATHTVVTGDNEPGGTITMPDVEISSNVPPTIVFIIPPTPSNNSEVPVNYVNITVNVTDISRVSVVILNWNGTNETMTMIANNIWSVNKINLTNGIYTYKVYANDTSNLWSFSDTRFVTVNVSVVPFEIPIKTGWNLISLPVEVENTSIDAVLSDARDGDRVFAYDNGTWATATYYSALPGWYSASGLTTIEPDIGYWYSAIEAYNITGTGTEPTASSVSIVSDWSLIGYTRLTAADLDALITGSDSDMIYAYDEAYSAATYYSALPGWYSTTGLTTMDPGKGYWYKATESFIWEY